MSAKPATDWRQLCRELEVDPGEVEVVFSRFDAYRRFMAGGRGDRISLDQWFRFYHYEKQSEGGQTAGTVPSGCSVDAGAVNDACINRPQDFLAVLRAYVVAADGGEPPAA